MSPDARRAVGLGTLFGLLAFLQAIAEPTEGLAAQPVRSWLIRQGRGTAVDGAVLALIALPWTFKPLLGLLSDAVPLWGRRRQGYLILGGGVAALALFALAARPGPSIGALVGCLALATAAVACTDVASDALLIDRGRAIGRIGPLQAAQWGSAYAAGVVVGLVGGRWAGEHREDRALMACTLAALGIVALAAFAAREPRVGGQQTGLAEALRSWARAARSPGLLRVGGFLFLWNFNPFSTYILQRYMTGPLGHSEAHFGRSQSLMAVASIAACLAYAPIAVAVPFPALARASVPLGVVSTLLYWGLGGPASLLVVAAAVGFAYMLATLIQLELAARACPPEATGSVFATLMALENLAAALSTAVGGWCYDGWAVAWGETAAFRLLVALGAATTATSWFLLPPDRPAEIGPG
ncbi:hypothetical protein TA3x_002526 [Tundrisphaera sp. TA3]|uniref:hypothetical protein n=1 Tax=Tundrisphaera sp. TA3 TaxID=3435775 RepID=UPI003EC1414D